MPDYTPDQQLKLADEIEAAPRRAVWPRVVGDYGQMRMACRAIGEGNG